ncbi:MAG: GNAT family N-acetyltransferase, partial [Anaerolineales bacterium]|nr:GNAT family N-acetyltransferase [Anaerolineales bacterium]
RALKPIDDQEVWSITCFFVEKKHRRKGITVELLKAAVDYVKTQGGKIVEGYPVDVKKEAPAPFIFTGTAAAFKKAGFIETARNPVLPQEHRDSVSRVEGSPTRPIFRHFIQ